MHVTRATVESASLPAALRTLPRALSGYNFARDEYWHPEVLVRTSDGGVLRFSSLEHAVAPLFDVATLELDAVAYHPLSWVPFEPEFVISGVAMLKREEWLVPGAATPTIGVNPHTQFAGPLGSASEQAVASAVTLAGVLFTATDSRRLAVFTSSVAPLNIEVAIQADAVADVLASHTVEVIADAG